MIKVKVKQRVSIKGEYTINGKKFPNVITDVGLTEMAKCLVGHALPPLFIEGGYGTTAPLITDVDLDTPIPNGDIKFRVDVGNKQPYEVPRKQCEVNRITDETLGDNDVVIDFEQEIGGVAPNTGFPGKIEEVGMFDLPYKLINRGGVLYSRSLVNPGVITQNGLTGQMSWRLTMNKGDVSANGGIVHSALDVIAHNFMRKNNDSSYYANGLRQTDSERQYEAKYVDFWLNTIQTGRGNSPTSEQQAQLEDHIFEGQDDLARLTSVNITPASTSGGVEFPAIIKIQRALRFGDINEEIKEVGLFAVNRAEGHGTLSEKYLWGRYVLPIPIPAGDEAVIQFEIEIGR